MFNEHFRDISLTEMGEVKQPPPFDFDAENLDQQWRTWYQNFNYFLIAAKKIKEAEATKVAILLNQLGERGVELFNTFEFLKEDGETQDPDPKFNLVVKAFEKHFAPKKNVLHERYKFNKIILKPGQPILDFITLLKQAAATCEYTDKSEMIRDRLVEQIVDKILLDKLLDKGGELTLEEAITICKQHEQRRMEIQDFDKDKKQEIDAVKKTQWKQSPRGRTNTSTDKPYDCFKCGYRHTKGNCPAYNKKCTYCNEFNHFEIGCKKKKHISSQVEQRVNKKKYKNKNYRYNRSIENKNDEISESEESEGNVFIDVIKIDKINSNNAWSVIAKINNEQIKFKIDTGSEVNVLPLRIFEIIKTKYLHMQNKFICI